MSIREQTSYVNSTLKNVRINYWKYENPKKQKKRKDRIDAAVADF